MLLHTPPSFHSATLPSHKQQNIPLLRKLHHHHQNYCSCTINTTNVAEIAHNKVLIASAVSAVIGQLSKPFTASILYGNTTTNNNNSFDFKALFQAGGFPSTHSSAVVATATSLGLERGFSDSIFGLCVVYAALVMYDAQGVRREVGNHAKTLNRILPKTRVYSVSSMDRDNLTDSQPGTSSSGSESLGALLSEETTNYPSKRAPLLLNSDDRIRQVLMPSGTEADKEEESEFDARSAMTLKESIGHTEIEVIAGALLGFFVSLAVNTVA